MVCFEHTVAAPNGVHGHTAVRMTQEARELPSHVTITKDDKRACATHLFELLALGAKQGDKLRITVEGKYAPADAVRLRAFCKAYF